MMVTPDSTSEQTRISHFTRVIGIVVLALRTCSPLLKS